MEYDTQSGRTTLHFAMFAMLAITGVNSRAELLTLAPGLRLKQRYAPLARD